MDLSLNGEIALVTGASRGIGKGIALALGHAGAKVIGTATTPAGAEAITQYLKENKVLGSGQVVDVVSMDSINALMSNLEEMPSILVNNAAITRDALLLKMSPEDWNAVMATNLTSVYHLTKICLKSMLKARHGRIITITSLVGLTGNAGQTNYAATKAGVIAFGKSLVKEVGGRGITINTIAPGLIETDMTKKLPESYLNTLLQQIPLNRTGSIEDVAAVAVFLASKAAGYITGETIHVNGGMYMS